MRAASRPSHSHGDRAQLAVLLSGAGLVEFEAATLALTDPLLRVGQPLGRAALGHRASAYVASLSATDRGHYREALHVQVGLSAGDFVLTAASRATRGVVPR